MNILYVTGNDVVGQHFNGYLVHKALRELDHDSHMAVALSGFKQSEVHELNSPIFKYINGFFVLLERALSLYSILPLSAFKLYFKKYYRKADIVHLQLVHSLAFFSLLHVPIMSRQNRLVWTIHDPWLMSGHCIHSLDCERWLSGCGNCPDLTLPIPIRRDTTAFMWKIKRLVMHNSDITLVVASEWMYDRVQRSPILSHLPCHIIPFGINTAVFRPLDQTECRKRFGIPDDANVIAFRWTPHFVIKGSEYIKKTLEILKLDKPTYLLLFDAPHSYGLKSLQHVYQFIDLGWVGDPNQVALALSAADLFLMPSIAESFGMMALESMACGTPVIVFEGTSLASIIHAPHGGIAVPYKDHEALAEAIKLLLTNRALNHSLVEKGLKIVKQEYSLDLYVNRHIELYENLMVNER